MKIFIIIFLFSGQAFTQENSIWIPPEKDSLLVMLDHAYNLEFSDFDRMLASYQKKHPERPEGIFAPVVAWWIKVSTDLWNPIYDNVFIDVVDSIIVELEKIEEENRLYRVAEFYLYSATGFKGIINVTRENWISAALNGRVAFKGVEKALNGQIPNPDAKFGTGLYLYYADILPERYPILKPLFYFYPDGDKKLGLQQLENTITQGLFSKVVSAYMYSVILFTREKKLLTAYSVMKKLYEKYPQNPTFLSWSTGMALRLNLLSEAEPLLDIYKDRVLKGLPYYPRNKLRIINLRYGNIHFQRKEYKKALEYFNKAIQPIEGPMEEKLERYKIYALLDAGRCHVKLNQISEAIKKFEIVLDMDEHRNSHDQAEKELEKINRIN